MACPYFMPVEKLENGTWLHASRLPLGCGWSGHCTAPGHEGESPSQEDLQEFCNLGYAEGCGRLPRDRKWDSIRFGARTMGDDGKNGTGRRIQVRYVCERDHRPAEHGMLEFDATGNRWEQRHPDNRLQRMAECFVASYVEKRKRQETAPVVAS
ncbi:MAG: hypothetical protein WBW60_19105 [Candidatus Sulfotelmatobacter sp.]